jgi:hypothetical protein
LFHCNCRREGERVAAINNAVRDHASARHTLKSSEKLGKQRLERALRARFVDADVEGKGSLTKPQLEEALRSLNVLRFNAPKPGSFYKREALVLDKINLLFDFGDGMLSYNSCAPPSPDHAHCTLSCHANRFLCP